MRYEPKTELGTEYVNGFQERMVGGYKLTQQIGIGAFGAVTIGYKNGQQFAVKMYNLSQLKFRPDFEILLDKIKSEVCTMRELQHQNIMPILDHFQTNNNIYLVFKLYKEGDLLHHINKSGFLSEQKASNYLAQVTQALKYAEQKKIVHRDIKPENLLLDGDKIIVADFGLAKFITGDVTHTILGTASFIAPEVLTGQGYGFKADIWSLGVTFYMAIFGNDPWGRYKYGNSNSEGKFRLVSQTGGDPTRLSITPETCGPNLRFPASPKISDRMKTVLQSMIVHDPIQRASLKTVQELLSKPLSAFTSDFIASFHKTLVPDTEEQPVNSEILNHAKFDQHPALSKLVETSTIINHFKVDSKSTKSHTADILLSTLVQANAANISVPITTTILHPKMRPEEAEEQFLEQYINFNISICEYFFEGCRDIQTLIRTNPLINRIRGPLILACNMLAKKVVQIATYFIDRLCKSETVFTEIGTNYSYPKYEFYQNNFAKQYLERFEDIQFEAVIINSGTEDEARTCLPANYYRRDYQLQIASKCNSFTSVEEECLNLAIFYTLTGIQKFESQFNQKQVNEAKYLILTLKSICFYKDVVIFKAGKDSMEELCQTIKRLTEPSLLESQYLQDRDYFRKWKDSLKN